MMKLLSVHSALMWIRFLHLYTSLNFKSDVKFSLEGALLESQRFILWWAWVNWWDLVLMVSMVSDQRTERTKNWTEQVKCLQPVWPLTPESQKSLRLTQEDVESAGEDVFTTVFDCFLSGIIVDIHASDNITETTPAGIDLVRLVWPESTEQNFSSVQVSSRSCRLLLFCLLHWSVCLWYFMILVFLSKESAGFEQRSQCSDSMLDQKLVDPGTESRDSQRNWNYR